MIVAESPLYSEHQHLNGHGMMSTEKEDISMSYPERDGGEDEHEDATVEEKAAKKEKKPKKKDKKAKKSSKSKSKKHSENGNLDEDHVVSWGSEPQDEDSYSGSSSDSEDGIADPIEPRNSRRQEYDQHRGSVGGGHNSQYDHFDEPSVFSHNTGISTANAAQTTTPTPLVETHVAVRVIKGEIHNLMGVMRSSEQRYISAQRFHDELAEDIHPLVQQFQDLLGALNDWDLQMAVPHPSMLPKKQLQALKKGHTDVDPWVATPDALLYLPPFCEAIKSRDITAPVTGAALGALHKFLIYGFVNPNVAPNAKAGMSMIADALLNCTFEETSVQQRQRRNQITLNKHNSGASSRSLMHHSSSGSVASGTTTGNDTKNSMGSSIRNLKAKSTSQQHLPYYHPTRVDDEQVVLKLLDLAAMVVRCSFIVVEQGEMVLETCLISSDYVVGLLDTCLHVSHIAKSASPLLKSAAIDALSQIVLQVFAGRRSTNNQDPRSLVVRARQEVLDKLASLLNPSGFSEEVIVSSLTAVNIALETSRENLTPREISILQNDLCKYLLQWSTTSDLHILALTLRVIFNLFQSIQNHLKVPLEVFLTSVHLRILEVKPAHNADGTPAIVPYHNHEEREVVLESILEFCQEPALMQDVYKNYDCDVACTNLYEQIVATLGQTAMPNDSLMSRYSLLAEQKGHANAASTSSLATNGTVPTNKNASAASFFTVQTAPAPVTQLNKLALEGLLAILNSIARRVHADRSPFLQGIGTSNVRGSIAFTTADDMESVAGSTTGGLSEEELAQRKQEKLALVQVADVFNEDPMGQSWLEMAVNLDVLDSVKNAKGAARILYMASGLDKAKVGIYLSKGPESDYPFQTEVRHEFVSMYDFSEMPFAAALRLFLSKFRLPGEAQCIDRFMESFSTELYRQQGGNRDSLFKNSDAVYVLSFSTIMLNTDLHNPGIKEENRMTKDQFIKNNRGINDGEDLPPEYLSELFDQIREAQIQVQRDVGEFMKKEEDDEDFRSAWDSILAKHREVAAASFTPAGMARRNIFKAGMHDREMFTVLVKYTMQALPAVFEKSFDDVVVYKTMRGLKQMAMIADYFNMGDFVNDIIEILLKHGRDYIVECIKKDHDAAAKAAHPMNQNISSRSLETTDEEGDESTVYSSAAAEDTETQIPYSLLSVGRGYSEVDFFGAAHHRGLLALDTSFLLIRRYPRRVISAWSLFIECLCAMRDANALPVGLSELDDFADSNGNVLPLSPFAKLSQRRLDDFYTSKTDWNDRRLQIGEIGLAKEAGWFSQLFKGSSANLKPQDDWDDSTIVTTRSDARPIRPSKASEATKALGAVAETANVEKIVQMGSTKLPVAEQTIRSLLDVVDEYPYADPVAEQHAIFSLELAARALLSNRERAVEIFPVFLQKFESVLGKVSDTSVPSPFVIERIVVTILRCSIHLYDVEELRPNLRVSLHLLVMSCPRVFIRDIADRMACGLAIILRASFPFFESHNEWTFMGDTLDTLANFANARVFVFDGIASTVECAVPQAKGNKDDDSRSPQFQLTKEGCGALSRILIRFVLGFYQSDFSLSVPASVCLEKLYRHMNVLILEEEAAYKSKKKGKKVKVTEEDKKNRIPNKDYWQNIAVALYSVCRSPDPEVSRHGYEICQRIILRAPLQEIPVDKWMAILYLMVNKQPPMAADLSRSNTFVLLGNMLMRVLPYLSKRQRPEDADEDDEDDDMVDSEDLSDLVRQTATLAGDNLRHGRRGRVSPLFEKTLQTVTYLSNHMQTDEWEGEKEFGLWASETLLAELEKVGAAGGSVQNQEAVKGKNDDESTSSQESSDGEEDKKDDREDDDEASG